MAVTSVTLRGVSKVYPNGVVALRSVDLHLAERELTVLVGPSGCGKTTLLRLIAGLEEPTEGSVLLDGTIVSNRPPKDRDVAMVFQDGALYSHMSVYNNMAFGLRLRTGNGWIADAMRRLFQPRLAAELSQQRREIHSRVQRAAEMLGIEDLLRRMPGQLSGGQRQRVALGRAVVREPAVFLFDEPLSGLDAQLRVEMRREIRRLHRHLGTTMVYVTHDIREAMAIGDQIAVIGDGALQQVGAPRTVYNQPANLFVAQFVGSSTMNLIVGRLRFENDTTAFEYSAGVIKLYGEQVCDADINEDEWRHPESVVLGIRAEDITCQPTGTSSKSGLDGPGENERRTVMRAVVDEMEMLGDTAYVHAVLLTDTTLLTDKTKNESNLSPQKIVCKVPGLTELQPGDRVDLELDVKKIHLFQRSTGSSLASRISTE